MTVLHIDIPSQSLQEEQVITLNSELFIQGVKRGDAGKLLGNLLNRILEQFLGLYYCVAKNSQGLINKSVELEVYCESLLQSVGRYRSHFSLFRRSERDYDGLADDSDGGGGLPAVVVRGKSLIPIVS